jgi:hypothetical protein
LNLNPNRFDINPKIVTSTFLTALDQVLLELNGLGVPDFSNISTWTNALRPHGGPNILSDTESKHSSDVAESKNVSETTAESQDATKDGDSAGSALL